MISSISGLLRVETGEPAPLDTHSGTYWLVFISSDTVQLVFDLLDQVEIKELEHEVYGIETHTRLVTPEQLEENVAWFFYLNDPSLLETLHVQGCPWYVGITDGSLVYSAGQPPVLPLDAVPFIQPKPELSPIVEKPPPPVKTPADPTIKITLNQHASDKLSALAQKKTDPTPPKETNSREVAMLQQKAFKYEQQMLNYEEEVRRLKQRLEARNSELQTLQSLVETRQAVQPRPQRFKTPESYKSFAQLRFEDLEFWKIQGEPPKEISLDDQAFSNGLWLFSVEQSKVPRRILRGNRTQSENPTRVPRVLPQIRSRTKMPPPHGLSQVRLRR